MKRILFFFALLFSLLSCARSQSGILGPVTTTTPALPATLRERLLPMEGTLKLHNASTAGYLEPTVVKESTGVKVYFTASFGDTDNRLAYVSVSNIEDVWPAPTVIIGQGAGGAPVGRNAHSSTVVKSGGTYYAYALNGYGYPGEDRNVYLYTSTDGTTFTDAGKVLDTSLITGLAGYGNTAIVQDLSGAPVLIGGKYRMVAEGYTTSNLWEPFLMEADALTGPWSVVQKLSSLQIGVGMYGGACVKYVDGVYHAFYHYGATANLPTNLAWATSSDGLTWTVKEAGFKMYYDADPTPTTTGETNEPFPRTDQIADAWIEEINGATYLVAEYGENYPAVHFQIRVWKFNGTFAQMISGL